MQITVNNLTLEGGKYYKLDYSEYQCLIARFKGAMKLADGSWLYWFVPENWKCNLLLREEELIIVVAEVDEPQGEG